MDRNQIKTTVLAEIKAIAPEVQVEQLEPERALREQVDLDSMDWLNFLIALHHKLNVEIPEADYGRLRTIDNLVDYIGARIP